MRSRGWLATLAFVGGCTLALPSRDYFDDAGVETIAIADGVEAIALAGEWLYLTDGTRVARVPAHRGESEPEDVARAARGPIHGLVGNGVSLAAWCEGDDGGAWYAVADGPATRLPDSTSCSSVAVSSDAVAYVAGGGGVRVRRFMIARQAYEADVTVEGPPDSVAIGVASSGALVASTRAGIFRTCVPGDVGCEDGLCRIAAISPSGVRAVRTIGAGASLRPILVTPFQGVFIAPSSTCCPFDATECAADALRSRRGIPSNEEIEVLGDVLYAQRQGAVTRIWSFSDPARDEVVAPSSSSARFLAVDEGHAFFLDGRKIQRAPLRAADPALCAEGGRVCGGVCVDVEDPVFGCAASRCSPCALPNTALLACNGGACKVGNCTSHFGNCNGRDDDGCETDLLAPETCGACGVVCSEHESCSKRGCGVCNEKETPCLRRCVELDNDVNNCGACGRVCPSGPHGTARCKEGECVLRCEAGYGNCDNDPSNGCEPVFPYYRDGDGDGYGAEPAVGYACKPQAGFAADGGDCLDTDSRVHPGQAAYFDVPYRAGAASIPSFDYDCDGAERSSPSGTAGACGGVVCAIGYVPAVAQASKANRYCGSTARYACGDPGTCPTEPAPAWGCH